MIGYYQFSLLTDGSTRNHGVSLDKPTQLIAGGGVAAGGAVLRRRRPGVLGVRPPSSAHVGERSRGDAGGVRWYLSDGAQCAAGMHGMYGEHCQMLSALL